MTPAVHRTDETTPVSNPLPAVGVVLAAVSLAGMGIPFRRGVTEPAVLIGTVLGSITLGAFLGRRYGVLDRFVGGWLAAGAGFGLVLVSGYALNQGITGAVTIRGTSSSFSIVFVGFLTAGATVGIGIADSLGLTGRGVLERTKISAGLVVVGVIALFTAVFVVELFGVVVTGLLGELPQMGLIAISQLGFAVGTALVAVVFIAQTGRDWSFIDWRMPTLYDVSWIVGGIALIFGALLVIVQILASFGVESASHGTVEQAAENPEILLVLVPASILIIGPFEELLYRNVVQKTLYEQFSRYGAVIVASVIFAGIHVLAYSTAEIGAVIASLGVVFGLSLVLGICYERTDNLVVPALVHGLYDAILFANLYLYYI